MYCFQHVLKKELCKDLKKKIFSNDLSESTLCFDLRNESKPISGIVFNYSQIQDVESHIIEIPFGTKDVEENVDLFLTWGVYKDTTIIQYITSSNSNSKYGIEIIPIFGDLSALSTDIGYLSETIYYENSGNEYIFIYKYPEFDEKRKKRSVAEVRQVFTKFDSIGIALPAKSTGLEIDDTGKTFLPDPIFYNDFAYFFPGTGEGLSETEAIIVRYSLPVSETQKFIFNLIFKLFTVTAPYIIQILTIKLLLSPTDEINWKSRRRWSVFLLVVQLVCSIALGIWAALGSSSSQNLALGDIIAAVIGGIISSILLIEKLKIKKMD